MASGSSRREGEKSVEKDFESEKVSKSPKKKVIDAEEAKEMFDALTKYVIRDPFFKRHDLAMNNCLGAIRCPNCKLNPSG
jgi:hypothetical protein